MAEQPAIRRIVGGDRLMWSGGSTTWRGDAKRYSDWLGQTIQQTYPQLGAVKISDVWSGTMGFTVHRMPQIGEITPGLWLLSGFGSRGLNTTAMGGEIVKKYRVYERSL